MDAFVSLGEAAMRVVRSLDSGSGKEPHRAVDQRAHRKRGEHETRQSDDEVPQHGYSSVRVKGEGVAAHGATAATPVARENRSKTRAVITPRLSAA